MHFDMLRHDGAGNTLTRAKTNSAIIKDARPHDDKARADDHEGKPGTVETTRIHDFKIFSPAKATPQNAQERLASFDF